MKPAKFEYFAPTSLAEALELLEEHGDDAKVLAGGQSLMPMLNMRLALPEVVVDINRIPGLDWGSHPPALCGKIGCSPGKNPGACGGYAVHRPLPDTQPRDRGREHLPCRSRSRTAGYLLRP